MCEFSRSERIAKTYPTTSIRISSGSIDGRPTDEKRGESSLRSQERSSAVSIFRMIFGNRVAKMKLVEKLTLANLQMAHHGSTSPRFASAQRSHGSRSVSADF